MVWVNTWSDADDAALVHKREIERKGMPAIAIEMSRALRSCYGRYAKIVSARPVVLPIAPEPPRRIPAPHERLGIKTFTHRQAVLCEPDGGRGKSSEFGFGYDAINRCWSNNHLFRASVTLAKVLA